MVFDGASNETCPKAMVCKRRKQHVLRSHKDQSGSLLRIHQCICMWPIYSSDGQSRPLSDLDIKEPSTSAD